MNDWTTPPSAILLTDNKYVVVDELIYFSHDPDTNKVQLLYKGGVGITVEDVKEKDFKRLADTLNHYHIEEQRAKVS